MGGGRMDEGAGREVLSPSANGKNKRRNPRIIIIVYEIAVKLIDFYSSLYSANKSLTGRISI